MYRNNSASVVDKAISVCILLTHRMGQLANVIIYPILDKTDTFSCAVSCENVPAKSAAT